MRHVTPLPGADQSVRLAPLTLILGGARSGKSSYAEALLAAAPERLYLATGQAGDDEMAERIRHHQERRGDGWITVEEPLDLAAALSRHARPDRPILVDCLTLWLSNLLLGEADVDVDAEIARLVGALPDLAGPIIFVSNEVGQGIVPDNPLARRFRDHAGRLNQAVAARCQRVVFIAAGLPLLLKDFE
ncbi:bifunctional adenosylcobinamide kinase/adenosylcobinamide-phosphate guanylyltransferase [Telmatospirillum sp.]|uniref:bifunctional adenosylcobinamide kinase/adenosylcobinamide-phosphate guanylyltransferase n=1 Tax=Telmatospirillum sp. TaxID=2079197 RepID=UPI00284B0232|nr:bifunctional adenosylcobinamide kinase/adenosylcobinamide-phosphate guanylyltransferase [Telmatospirillum sp.]MDR3437583.1 bifunctional adenosylcobinamide kinase/adenosylcobinamide-phosphate guanylyltransferase [Telmatospirillum sp.]